MVSFQDRPNEEVDSDNEETGKEETSPITWQVHLVIPASEKDDKELTRIELPFVEFEAVQNHEVIECELKMNEIHSFVLMINTADEDLDDQSKWSEYIG